jgi:hypothetical protein
MSYEDTITIPKPQKGEARGVVTSKQAQAALNRGLKGVSEIYGFDLPANDPRCTVRGTRREGDKAIVTFGANGRRLDADQLAYELNN